jgi:excisionase family DNA binding protein
MFPPMNRYYTTFEAARLLGVSLPTVVNWIKARRLKAHRTPGGHRRIAREDLAGFMVRHGMPLPAELSDAVAGRRKALVIAEGGPHREGITRRLAHAGYAVDQVSPGFAAGAAAARFEPDVVVLHATSPDGGDPLRGLRADRELSSIPVVALAQAEWVDSLREAGCVAAVPRIPADGALEDAVVAALRGAGAKGARDGAARALAAPRVKGPGRRPRAD